MNILGEYYFFILGFSLSLFASFLIYKTKKFHIAFSTDTISGCQKVHTDSVPRIGGISLYFSTVVASIIYLNELFLFELFISVTCIFLVGLWEDFSKNVSSWLRLLASFVSAYLLVSYFDHSITSSGIGFIDSALEWLPIWGLLTIIFIVTAVNSINFIDGFNGLASGVTIITFAMLGVLAIQNGDFELLNLIVFLMCVILGFFIINFPKGLIFLGDGGAYFCGFAISFVSIILLERNPTIETTILFVVFAYPLIEIIFSIFRKALREGYRPDRPDRVHFHMLLFRKLRSSGKNGLINCNAKTGLYLQLMPLSGLVFVFFGFNNKLLNLCYFLGVCFVYLRLYRKLSLNG